MERSVSFSSYEYASYETENVGFRGFLCGCMQVTFCDPL